MNIVDTSGELLSAFNEGRFDLSRWEEYIDSYVPGAKELCLSDMNDCIKAGFSWENDFLPVLNNVFQNAPLRKKSVKTFLAVTESLEYRIIEVFGKMPEVDIILYLGLCNGAGWVTEIGGKTVILLGIEKIMELNWCDSDAMTGLIVHETGHVFQSQYGVLYRETESLSDRFVWQLFTEGVAMVFEQEIVGDPGYYHQDKDGWREWCSRNADLIRRSFCDDLKRMTQENQRYFGDWVRFEGYGDTGYYLGGRFVRFILEKDSFERVITYDIEQVKDCFDRFMKSSL